MPQSRSGCKTTDLNSYRARVNKTTSFYLAEEINFRECEYGKLFVSMLRQQDSLTTFHLTHFDIALLLILSPVVLTWDTSKKCSDMQASPQHSDIPMSILDDWEPSISNITQEAKQLLERYTQAFAWYRQAHEQCLTPFLKQYSWALLSSINWASLLNKYK